MPGYLHCSKMKAGEAVHQAVLGAGKWGTSETKTNTIILLKEGMAGAGMVGGVTMEEVTIDGNAGQM